MNNQISTAVIVAAGFGSRLKEKTKFIPKGFIEIEGISLIERSLNNLIQSGIKRVLIGTGHLQEQYQELAKKYPFITCIHSENYANTSSMETLYVMRDHIQEDFILLESDLLYQPQALEYVVNSPDTVLASGKTYSNDEVYIQAIDNYLLENMSKDASQLSSIYGELVGITAISNHSYKLMCDYYANQDNKKIDYEYVLVGITPQKDLKVKKIENLAWCEIDDANHLDRATDLIYPRIKAKSMHIKRNILLNPGPATTTDTVKMAQIVPDICPRETEFGDLMEYVSKELTSIVASPETHTTVLFGGSGTAAVEALLTSVVPHDKSVLIVNNGSYGKRMCQIAQRYKMNYIEFNSSAIEPIDLDKLEAYIAAHNNSTKIEEHDNIGDGNDNGNKKFAISHIAVIHNETTTGLLNDLDDLGEIAKNHGLDLIVDAMSSYAAIPIDMVKQNIAYLTASSNKNIQGMAGVGFVIASTEKLDSLANIEPRTFYLSLFEQYQNFIKTHQMRFTPPVQTLYALKQAVIEAKAEGIANRYQRYSDSWELLITELKAMGLSYLVEDAHHSKIITSIHLPDGIDFNHMHDYFYDLGITIYPGKVDEFNTFRISNIGQIYKEDMARFIDLLKVYLKKPL